MFPSIVSMILKAGRFESLRIYAGGCEQVAQMYKARWQIEVFFRWIKQHLNIPTLFGTTETAVYGQLFGALMVYLKWMFDATNPTLPRHATLSFARFSRLFALGRLPIEWLMRIQHIVQKYNHFWFIEVT